MTNDLFGTNTRQVDNGVCKLSLFSSSSAENVNHIQGVSSHEQTLNFLGRFSARMDRTDSSVANVLKLSDKLQIF